MADFQICISVLLNLVSFYYFWVFLSGVLLFTDYIFIALFTISAEKMLFIVIAIAIAGYGWRRLNSLS